MCIKLHLNNYNLKLKSSKIYIYIYINEGMLPKAAIQSRSQKICLITRWRCSKSSKNLTTPLSPNCPQYTQRNTLPYFFNSGVDKYLPHQKSCIWVIVFSINYNTLTNNENTNDQISLASVHQTMKLLARDTQLNSHFSCTYNTDQ